MLIHVYLWSPFRVPLGPHSAYLWVPILRTPGPSFCVPLVLIFHTPGSPFHVITGSPFHVLLVLTFLCRTTFVTFLVDPSLSKAEYGIAKEISSKYVSVCVCVCVCVCMCMCVCVFTNTLTCVHAPSVYACWQGFRFNLFDLGHSILVPSLSPPSPLLPLPLPLHCTERSE